MLTIATLVLAGQYTLVVGGDVMLNGIRFGTKPLAGVASTFRKADFAFVNLEVPLTNAKIPTSRKTAAELKARSQFVLKADPRHIQSLVDAGIDGVSLANNHAMDYGPKGLSQMRAILYKARISAAGAASNGDTASGLAIVKGRDGFRVGLLSALAFMGRSALRKCGPAGPKSPGVNVLAFDGKIDEAARAKLKSWVGGAKSRCDYLIVALHWGIERQTKPTGYQKALAKAVVESGADLVWGHHPHVLQHKEAYQQTPILYSTGNLVSPLPAKTALYRLNIDRHSTSGVIILPASISGGKVKLDSSIQSQRRKRIIR